MALGVFSHPGSAVPSAAMGVGSIATVSSLSLMLSAHRCHQVFTKICYNCHREALELQECGEFDSFPEMELQLARLGGDQVEISVANKPTCSLSLEGWDPQHLSHYSLSKRFIFGHESRLPICYMLSYSSVFTQ